MPLAFVCAMPMELAPLRKKLGLAKSRIGSLEVQRGMLGDRPVVAIATGMGTTFARQKLTALMDAVEVDRVVVVGITGALDDGTAIGSLVVPEIVVNGATGAEYRPHPLGEGRPYGTVHGKMWTSDALVTDPDVLADLRRDGVVCLDMETAAVADVCEARGVPWSVFRTVSDRVTDGIVDEEVFRLSHQDGTPDFGAIAGFAVRHPGRLRALARTANDFRVATGRAAEAAIAAVSGS